MKKIETMTQITINMPNDAEAQWLVQLLNRLQVPFQLDVDEVTKRERAKEIIMRGADTLATESMLEAIRQSRQDRKLLFENL